jgi:uncharacterized glyoxalase superfamily protein PhnB
VAGEHPLTGTAIPMVSYADVAAAADWLRSAFGLEERAARFTDGAGRVTHVELSNGDGTIMLGWPGPAYLDPIDHLHVCDSARKWLDVPWVVDGVMVIVDDVDAHHARAVTAGAVIIRELEDAPPGRLYSAADPFGHRWMFLQPRQP